MTGFQKPFRTFCFSIRLGAFLFGYLIASILSFGPVSAESAILINEIYYDAPGSDEGYEFIELINSADSSLCLEGYCLEFHNGAGVGWLQFWCGDTGDSVSPHGVFVIGEAKLSTTADVVVDLPLQNGPDAVRLTYDELNRDLIGYGDLNDRAYFEESPAAPAPPGSSLGRWPDGRDTDNNFLDFRPMYPNPGLMNVPRRDLGLSVMGAHALSMQGAPAEFSVWVHNRGANPVAPYAYSVEVYDSISAGSDLISSLEGLEELDQGDSTKLDFSIFLGNGYHLLVFFLRFPGDERPHDNEAELIARIGTPTVLISEVMSYPEETCPQYVELYNFGFEPVRISGWKIRDTSHAFSIIADRSFMLKPSEYVVVAGDSRTLQQCFPSVPGDKILSTLGTWPRLNHTGSSAVADSVFLADSLDLVVDSVAYPPQDASTRGTSLERLDLYPGSGRHIWVYSSDASGGTPGRGCEGAVLNGRIGGNLQVHPNPFSPREGMGLIIEVPYVKGASRVRVSVFDINGNIIRSIGTSSSLPAVFLWKGTAGDGEIVPSGIYLLVCEFFSKNGHRDRVEKVVVGCGREKQ